jgi:hypothetical protein
VKNHRFNLCCFSFLLILPGFQGFAQHSIELKVSNDMTYFTDQYYSSGIELYYFNSSAKKSTLDFIHLPSKPNSRIYRGLSFTHNMYTPTDTYTPEINAEDHPYASYVLLGTIKESFHYPTKTKITSSLQLGWMGPMAGGQLFQNTMHSMISIAEHVEGWHNQVGNDVCIQYQAGITKGLFQMEGLEVNVFTSTRLGSPHTDAQGGIHLRTGIFDSFFRNNGISDQQTLQIWFFTAADANFVYFNAALQGGLNNPRNPHTIQQIHPNYWHLAFGGAMVFKKVKLELAQEVISPQFESMGWHRWAYIALLMGF